MSAPSIRAAALAFALSSWVEGLTQIRAVVLMPYLPWSVSAHQQQPDSALSHGTWVDRTVAWLKRKGREMDETERTSFAVVDVSTAFLILRSLGQPIFPFLLSPLLATLPLPRSSDGFRPIKWHYLIITTLILSLLHEVERVSVCLAVGCVRKCREARNKRVLGEVYVGGSEQCPLQDENENDEEQDECLICAGVDADHTLSQSTSSMSSMSRVSPMNTSGPLEAFCVTAPQKHLAHRSCFLSWHAAYRQQRAHLPPEEVELKHGGYEASMTRAASILHAAGFGHLSQHLRFPHEISRQSIHSSHLHPTLTLMNNLEEPPPSARSPTKCLAMLLTAIPPCPGCRSPVLLHFFSRPFSPQNGAQPLTCKEGIGILVRLWLEHWHKLVTGRTISYQVVSQWSFVMALLSMMRVSGKGVRRTHA